jgi:1-acyl-sn-glycerol-3-phosphate acyltransferase
MSAVDFDDEIPMGVEKADGFYRFVRSLLFPIARFFLDYGAPEVEGREHIPPHGAFIFASNHASNLDPPVLALASPRPLTFLAKVELFHKPIFSRLIRSLGAFPIVRGSRDSKAMVTAVEFLKRGHCLVVFPEGTRTRTGRMGRIRSGVAVLAVKAGVPIVPAYIEGTFAAWPKGGKLRRAPVRVRIGAPISPAGVADEMKGYSEIVKRLDASLKTLVGDAESRLAPPGGEAEMELSSETER